MDWGPYDDRADIEYENSESNHDNDYRNQQSLSFQRNASQ